MKNLFTFIVALFMATGVYAQEKQTYKSFEGTTVWFPTQTEVQKAIDEGWASVGMVTEKTPVFATNKAGNVNPNTDKKTGKIMLDGIQIKSAVNRTLTLYVTGISYLKAYAVTTNTRDTRVIKVTATPTDGDPVVASSTSTPEVSAVVSLILEPTKKYKVVFEGYKSDMSAGADLALHGVRFIPSTSPSTSVAIGEAGFATLAPSFAVDYSNRGDGLEAYSVSYNSSSKELTYTQIDGVVAEGKAVILKGKGNYILEASSETATVTETGLKASDGNKTGADNIYCLANKASNGVGFYQVKSDVTIPANKAYLEIATPASTLAKYYSIGIGGNTTGIQTIHQNSVKADGIMYSLSGQRVGENYKGIVICNGKKMIKK